MKLHLFQYRSFCFFFLEILLVKSLPKNLCSAHFKLSIKNQNLNYYQVIWKNDIQSVNFMKIKFVSYETKKPEKPNWFLRSPDGFYLQPLNTNYKKSDCPIRKVPQLILYYNPFFVIKI